MPIWRHRCDMYARSPDDYECTSLSLRILSSWYLAADIYLSAAPGVVVQVESVNVFAASPAVSRFSTSYEEVL